MTNAQLKQNLVDAIRMMERSRITDFSGHFSTRVPGADHMFINSGQSVRSSLTVDDIVTIDMDGKLVEGSAAPPMEFHIHAEVYRRRPDVNAVAHAHTMWSTFFTMSGVALKLVMPNAAVLGPMPVFPKPDSINYKSIAQELVQMLGDNRIILLKSHGAVVAAEGVMEAFVLGFYLEENAYRQYMASHLGEPYALSADEIRVMAKNLWKPNLIKKTWDYHYSKLMQGSA